MGQRRHRPRHRPVRGGVHPRWWQHRGRADHPNAGRLLITADSGGSNDPRRWTWKSNLAAFARESGLEITVCHLPPGTSKWNKIEHRMFCDITANWRGRRLTSDQVVLETIAATTTGTGLTIGAELDTGSNERSALDAGGIAIAAKRTAGEGLSGAAFLLSHSVAHANNSKRRQPELL